MYIALCSSVGYINFKKLNKTMKLEPFGEEHVALFEHKLGFVFVFSTFF